MTKPIQYFSDEYLEHCKSLTPDQIVQFLEDFREIVAASEPPKSKLISLKVPVSLLNVFKQKAKQEGKPYQSLIKQLMRDYVKNGH